MGDKMTDESDSCDSEGDENEEKCLRKRTKIEAIIFIVSTSINFGVIWRFTYVMQKDGGAIFIVPYFIMMILIGLPLCCLDLTLGWCSRLDAVRVWQLAKISSGLGFALAGIAAIVATYSGVIISWTFFYFFSSFRKDLPWSAQNYKHNAKESNCTLRAFCNETIGKNNWTNMDIAENNLKMSEIFFVQKIVNIQSESFNDFKYSLAICLAFTWICILIILGKGIRSAHKLAFLGTVLVVLIFCLTVGTTIKQNGYDNIRRFLAVKWMELLSVEPWYDAVAQVLFSLGLGYGSLITITNNKSYNSNCFLDCYFIVILQGLFSLLLTCIIAILNASQTNSNNPNNQLSDIGYVFILFAAHLSRLPGGCLWCGLFFFGMALMGLASNAWFVYSIYNWILTINCKWCCQYKKCFLALSLGLTFFSMGLLLTTSFGHAILRAIDQRVTELTAPLIAVLECLVIGWLYGGKKFISIMEVITGHKSRIPWKLMWEFVTPVVVATILLSKWVNDDDGNDAVVNINKTIGQTIADLPLYCIPLYALIMFIFTCISPNKKFGMLFTSSNSSWIPISSRIEKTNSCSLSRLNRRHYGESEPLMMVRIENPAFGKIPHGFFYNPKQKNINDILQNLTLLRPRLYSNEDSELVNQEENEVLNYKIKQQLQLNRDYENTQDYHLNLDYSTITNSGSSPLIVAHRVPYPSPLTLKHLPSLVILPPHGIWSSEPLPEINPAMLEFRNTL